MPEEENNEDAGEKKGRMCCGRCRCSSLVLKKNNSKKERNKCTCRNCVPVEDVVR